MAEIKHSFQAGKMNKDLDERLVPNGEYRDALNIEVRTSGDSDVGTAQTLYGNIERLPAAKDSEVNATELWTGEKSSFTGSIADERNNKAYFFVACSPIPRTPITSIDIVNEKIYKDMIIEYDNVSKKIEPVFVDIFRVDLPGIRAYSANVLNLQILKLSTSDAALIKPGMSVQAIDDTGQDTLQPQYSQVSANGQTDVKVLSVLPNGDVYLNKSIDYISSGDTDIAWIFGGQKTEHVLNFTRKDKEQRKLITAVNIVDDFLFWTDYNSEPKKISINRSKKGTQSFDSYTKLMLDNTDWNSSGLTPVSTLDFGTHPTETNRGNAKEEHITVIRKAPRTAPKLNMSSYKDGIEKDLLGTFSFDLSSSENENISQFESQDEIIINTSSLDAVSVGTTLILECKSVSPTVGMVVTVLEALDGSAYNCTIESQSTGLESNIHEDWSIRVEQNKPLFELKFGRFSYRYKYQDGEYSTFAPWSELAFIPGRFDYIPKKGYNLGMVNTVRYLRVEEFVPNHNQRPDDVVEVDILYKDTTSPNVYVVKSIKRDRNPEWSESNGSEHGGVLNVTSEMIHRTLPSSQTLRSWDNVPRYAKSQEITGNRLLYGNYVQNYNVNQPIAVKTGLESLEHKFDPRVAISSLSEPTAYWPNKSVKSIRNYRVGVVFGDKYGRETPVLGVGGLIPSTSDLGSHVPESINIEKKYSANNNKITAQVEWGNTNPSNWMEYYKFFIKETSSEYYNLVMDRWYNAEDGNVWLSFQSSDRNKLDIETYLILKNGHGSQEPVEEEARFKILAIENEAPDHIKTTNKILGAQFLSSDFNVITSLHETMIASFDESQWNNVFNGISFEGIGYARVRMIKGTDIKHSQWVKISRINSINYSVSLIETIGESANIVGLFGTSSGVTVELEIKDAVVENRPEFDGRFFVKIFRDSILSQYVLGETQDEVTYGVKNAFQAGYVYDEKTGNANQNAAQQGDWTTGSQVGTVYGGGSYVWDGNGITSGDVTHLGTCSRKVNTKAFWTWYQSDGPLGSNNAPRSHTWFLDDTKVAGEYFEPQYSDGDGGEVSGSSLVVEQNRNNGLDDGAYYNGQLVDGKSKMTFSIISNSPPNAQTMPFMNSMTTIGTYFRFAADPNKEVYQVIGAGNLYKNHNYHYAFPNVNGTGCQKCEESDHWSCFRQSFITRFAKVSDPLQGLDTSAWDPRSAIPHDGKAAMNIQILVANIDLAEPLEIENNDNAIWETEPKESVELDLYYEASDALPIYLNHSNSKSFVPLNSTVSRTTTGGLSTPFHIYYGIGQFFRNTKIIVSNIARDIVTLLNVGTVENQVAQSQGSAKAQISIGEKLKYTHSNGMVTETEVLDHWNSNGDLNQSYTPSEEIILSISEAKILASNPLSPRMLTVSASETNISHTGDPLFNSDGSKTWEVISENIPRGTFVVSNYQLDYFNDTTETSLDPISKGIQPNTSTTTLYLIRPGEEDSLGFITAAPLTDYAWQTQDVIFREVTGNFRLKYDTYKSKVTLPWFNCYSFGNGLESDRIRDDFNAPTIDNGCKVSTTLDVYGEETRGSGLIYSGIYNSNSGVNAFNEFNMAERITKDLNPSYGTIQALKSRDTNVVAFCEDKVLRILANKDALFNADGNVNVTASSNVLGNTTAFSGDYGISLNPESLAVDGYRMYFTDVQRRKILRLSQDGLTLISNNGMTTYFRDTLQGTKDVLGTFDEVKGEYNVTIGYTTNRNITKPSQTVSFSERAKGWSSFKSFIPETGLSINEEYITGVESRLWSHHDETVNANTFYGAKYNSTIDVMFNDVPGSVKTFNTINYEGTQAQISKSSGDGEYYNITAKEGWYVESFNTDKQEASVYNFIEKEGKWFNNITGLATTLKNLDTSEFSVQGIGTVSSVSAPDAPTSVTLTITENND